jgi:hypothetical protein
VSQKAAIGREVVALGAVAIIVVAVATYFSVANPGGPASTQAPPASTSTSQSIQSTLQSTTQSTCSASGSGATVTVTVGQSAPPCGCALVDSNSNGSLYISPSPRVGDNVCIQASLRTSPQVFLKVTDSNGSVVFSDHCAAIGQTSAPAPTGDTCLSFWNTAKPDPRGNAIRAGTYRLVAGGSSSTVSLKANFTLSGSVTGTSARSATNTFFTNCSITGIGGFELLVASDSTGAPVSGESVNAVDRLGCGSAQQVVYLDNFTVGRGGWLTPIFPEQATPGGQLNFTVAYQGRTYNFASSVPPIGTACVTLHVPSGRVTTTTVMNGNGSYCA